MRKLWSDNRTTQSDNKVHSCSWLQLDTMRDLEPARSIILGVSEGPLFLIRKSMQKHVSRLNSMLQFWGGRARQGNGVVMAEIDQRVAMHISGDKRLQFLDGLRVGEVIELNRVLLWIEIDDGLRADARLEHEIIIAGPAD